MIEQIESYRRRLFAHQAIHDSLVLLVATWCALFMAAWSYELLHTWRFSLGFLNFYASASFALISLIALLSWIFLMRPARLDRIARAQLLLALPEFRKMLEVYLSDWPEEFDDSHHLQLNHLILEEKIDAFEHRVEYQPPHRAFTFLLGCLAFAVFIGASFAFPRDYLKDLLQMQQQRILYVTQMLPRSTWLHHGEELALELRLNRRFHGGLKALLDRSDSAQRISFHKDKDHVYRSTLPPYDEEFTLKLKAEGLESKAIRYRGYPEHPLLIESMSKWKHDDEKIPLQVDKRRDLSFDEGEILIIEAELETCPYEEIRLVSAQNNPIAIKVNETTGKLIIALRADKSDELHFHWKFPRAKARSRLLAKLSCETRDIPVIKWLAPEHESQWPTKGHVEVNLHVRDHDPISEAVLFMTDFNGNEKQVPFTLTEQTQPLSLRLQLSQDDFASFKGPRVALCVAAIDQHPRPQIGYSDIRYLKSPYLVSTDQLWQQDEKLIDALLAQATPSQEELHRETPYHEELKEAKEEKESKEGTPEDSGEPGGEEISEEGENGGEEGEEGDGGEEGEEGGSGDEGESGGEGEGESGGEGEGEGGGEGEGEGGGEGDGEGGGKGEGEGGGKGEGQGEGGGAGGEGDSGGSQNQDGGDETSEGPKEEITSEEDLAKVKRDLLGRGDSRRKFDRVKGKDKGPTPWQSDPSDTQSINKDTSKSDGESLGGPESRSRVKPLAKTEFEAEIAKYHDSLKRLSIDEKRVSREYYKRLRDVNIEE